MRAPLATIVVALSVALFGGYHSCRRSAEKRGEAVLRSFYGGDLSGIAVIDTYAPKEGMFGDATYTWKLKLSPARLASLKQKRLADRFDLESLRSGMAVVDETFNEDLCDKLVRDHVDGYSVYILFGDGAEVYLIAFNT